jgi:two-component system sensor kinase FixL
VADVVGLLRADALSRQVSLEWTVQPGLAAISGDRVHLSQVLINLIINAMDAVMAREPPQRRVRVAARSVDGRTLEFEVRDSGPGIPEDSLERIFEPFFTTRSEGMGMGLSICRTIVDAHGGTLAACNDASGGAIFTVRLPFARESPA